MKQIATLLRIPRAHHAYINKYGSYDFIEKCEEIIKNNDSVRLLQEAFDERAVERQKVTVERVSKQRRGQSVPVEIPMPKFYKDKEIEREKIKEYIAQRKQDQVRLELQKQQVFGGLRDSKVYIDDTLIDLTDTIDNVEMKIE